MIPEAVKINEMIKHMGVECTKYVLVFGTEHKYKCLKM